MAASAGNATKRIKLVSTPKPPDENFFFIYRLRTSQPSPSNENPFSFGRFTPISSRLARQTIRIILARGFSRGTANVFPLSSEKRAKMKTVVQSNFAFCSRLLEASGIRSEEHTSELQSLR